MEKLKKTPIILLCTLLFLALFALPLFGFTGDISVLIARTSRGTVSGSAMTFTDVHGHRQSLYGSVEVITSGAAVKVAGKTMRMPVKVSSPAPLAWNGTKYMGDFVFKPSSGGFSLGNVVDIEDYLLSVLRAEMSPKWPVEALKAQAIIARTYAVKARGSAKEDFDLCSSTNSQLYKGIPENNPNISQAVETTRGMILLWQGGPASAFYHTDSGGMVTSARAVWGGNVPYLRAIPEAVDYRGPNTEWKTTMTMSHIESRFAANGFKIGTINSITPISRDDSGRITVIEIKGNRGTERISGNRFRSILGATKIKSTLFEIGQRTPYKVKAENVPKPAEEIKKDPPALDPKSTDIPVQKENKAVESKKTKYPPMNVDLNEMPADPEDSLVWMTEKGVFTTYELMQILSRPDQYNSKVDTGIKRIKGELPPPSREVPKKKKAQAKSAASAYSLPAIKFSELPNLSNAPGSGSSVTFYGRGYGHGVGMSQWGAKAMADKGYSYIEILKHYFPGTEISQ
jgi:stage II sporulation protein D